MLNSFTKDEIVAISFEILIKAVLLGVVLFYAFSILKPFMIHVLWGIIIAVALAPVVDKMEKKYNIKRTLFVTIFTIVTISAIIVPTYLLSDTVISSSKELAVGLRDGTLSVPPANENVKEWPVVGNEIFGFWNSAAQNLETTLTELKPKLSEYAPKIASIVGSLFGSILGFIVALIISAVFLVKAKESARVYQAISCRIVGDKGMAWTNLSALTIRSVVQGVIGIALVQAILSFLGMYVIGVPFAWLWAFIVLFLAIIQLPPILILGPVIAYVFSYTDTTPATIFAIYAFVVGASDGFLKPIFLGRGVDIPMLVILLGAIGGMIFSGVIGLFVGAVGLSLAYKLFIAWLEDETLKETQQA